MQRLGLRPARKPNLRGARFKEEPAKQGRPSKAKGKKEDLKEKKLKHAKANSKHTKQKTKAKAEPKKETKARKHKTTKVKREPALKREKSSPEHYQREISQPETLTEMLHQEREHLEKLIDKYRDRKLFAVFPIAREMVESVLKTVIGSATKAVIRFLRMPLD